MIFNKIIMNPPYASILHLKILDKVINACIKNNCEIVNISPLAPFYEHFAYNRKLPIVLKNNYELKEIITEQTAEKQFGLSNIGSDLGIWKVSNGSLNINKIKTKLFKEKQELIHKLWQVSKEKQKLNTHILSYNNCKEPFILKFVYGLSLSNHGLNTKSSYNITSLNFETATTGKTSNHTRYLEFKTYEEQINAHNVYCSDIMRFYYKEVMRGRCDYSLVPWFEDFSKPISTEDLITFFNLTKEDLQIITKTMEDFK